MLPRHCLPLLPLGLLACSEANPAQQPPAHVGLHVLTPQALLDEVDAMTLFVIDASLVTCDPSTGVVNADLREHAEAKKFPLGRTLANGAACPNGGVFCSDEITLENNPNLSLVFQAVGSRQQQLYALGCTSAAVNADPFYVNLQMFRYVEPTVCGDGILQGIEQCDNQGGPPSPDDPICDSTCLSKEILLSGDNDRFGQNRVLTNAPVGSKKAVGLAWTASPTSANPNALHAVFEDTNFGSGSGPEINYRQMSQHLLALETPYVLGGQVRLPLSPGNTGWDQRPRTQAAPSIGVLSDGSVVAAYEDDRFATQSNQVNISFTVLSPDGAASHADEVSINTLGVNACRTPSVAGGPPAHALVSWIDVAASRVRGRVWNGSGWVSEEKTFSSSRGDTPRVAGTDAGWIVAWSGRSNLDENDILMVRVGETGSPSAVTVVNQKTDGVQDQPAVAALPSGEFVVVWHDAGEIRMQRFDADGNALVADQDQPVNDLGSGSSPAVAASQMLSGFFAIAWQTDQASIQGRFAGVDGGFLFNHVDGQSGSFAASRPDLVGTRARPAVAIGGGGYVAFAWQDDSEERAGIWARRFPLPRR